MNYDGLRSNDRRGNNYHDNIVSGNGRAHFGNVIAETVHYYVVPPTSESFHLSNATSILLDQPGHESRKRRRTLDTYGIQSNEAQQEPLATVLSKLQKLATSVETPVRDVTASKVAGRIATIMDALRTSGSGCTLHKHTERQWSDLNDRLSVTRRLRLNSSPPVMCSGSVVRFERRYNVLRVGGWEISLTTTDTLSPVEGGQEQSISVLRLEPHCVNVGSPVVAFFGARTDLMQTNVIHPVIFAYRTIPQDSEIFRVIEQDDVEGLIKLLATQRFTKRDCDEAGRSLLQYACSLMSPSCCRYICESGADVDRRAPALTVDDNPVLPWFAARINEREMTEDEFARNLQCRESLLKAGADPTITNGPFSIPISDALGSSNFDRTSPATLELLFKYSKHFIDLDHLRFGNLSLWLHACSNCMFLKSPKILEMLLNAGCDIKETDNNGWNCLFHCVLGSHDPGTSKELEALRFLLGIFPDIHAKDKRGFTVFDYVDDDADDDEYGSYVRDLWYCSLLRAGLNGSGASELRKLDAQYTPLYTPQHHRALRYLDTWTMFWNRTLDMTQLDATHPMTEYEAAEMARIELLKEERFAESRSSESESESEFGESEWDERTDSEDEAGDTRELDDVR